MSGTIEITLLPEIDGISAAEWDGCGTAGNPFVTHRFLAALEASGSVGEGTGWHPAHLVARLAGRVEGVAPAYVKTHSQGEYIFDHAWAEAFARAGGDYYPKLQCAVPFTPATGPRLLSPDPRVRAALLRGMQQVAAGQGWSGAHLTFCSAEEAALAETQGFLPRVTQQFHWLNDGYADFDGFLAALSSRKRKAIRRERTTAQGFGGHFERLTGGDLRPEHWDAMWRFYQDTGARKWGRPYLTRGFFDALHETMRDDCLLVLAIREGRPIAGALNLIGADTLFGRYWGAVEHHDSLHFELCYYQAIDWAISRGLARVEAGAQGEHKLARGYLPTEIHSAHWVAEPGFYNALQDYLTEERAAMGEDIAVMRDWGPFRKG